MTCDLFMAHVEQMPRLRAERLFDAARAAGAPYQPAEWWDRLAEQAFGDDDGAASPVRRGSPVSFNGSPVPVGQLKLMLAGALGAGFSEAA